jgi:uncharacterized membrane protein
MVNANQSTQTKNERPTWNQLDKFAFLVGVFGFTCLIAGIAVIYWPAAFIAAGCGMLVWSYLMAKAVARNRSVSNQLANPSTPLI